MDQLNQAHNEGVVIGLKGVDTVRLRVDIDVMIKTQEDLFNLFIIALKELKGENKGESIQWDVDPGFNFEDQSDKMAFFSLAGIHGLPNSAWDNEGKTGSYCTHGLTNFPTWHRPYVALLEQTLYRQVQNVADRFSRSTKIDQPTKNRYKQVAKEFRLPYWDYYRPRAGPVEVPGVFAGKKTTSPWDWRMPLIFTQPEIMVKTLPDNVLRPMRNPFHSTVFNKRNMSDKDWVTGAGVNAPEYRVQTLRYNMVSDPVTSMNSVLNSIREDQARMVLCQMETGIYSSWYAFATMGALFPDKNGIIKPGTKPSGSLEAIHGQYHLQVGGFPNRQQRGHMTDVPVAAFDPVFWFHHCNIDRYTAIWQAVNPDHWFDGFVGKPAENIPPTAGLPPFRKYPLVKDPKTRYWTSDGVRDTEVLGYSYPDTWQMKDADAVQEAFAKRYGWSRRLTPHQDFGTPSEDMKPLDLSTAQVFQYTSGIPRPEILSMVASSTLLPQVHQKPIATMVQQVFQAAPKVSWEWYVDDLVERLALNGSFTIYYFIGDVYGRNAEEWVNSPSLVGLTHVFTSSVELCDNCGKSQEQSDLVTSSSPITSLLLDYVEADKLPSMLPEDVQPFLVRNLKWRVQSKDGTVIDPREMSTQHSLRLAVTSKTAPLPGETGEIVYDSYPDIIPAIIASASSTMS